MTRPIMPIKKCVTCKRLRSDLQEAETYLEDVHRESFNNAERIRCLKARLAVLEGGPKDAFPNDFWQGYMSAFIMVSGVVILIHRFC
jgi:hypothetical protein